MNALRDNWLYAIRQCRAMCLANDMREPHFIAGNADTRRRHAFGQWCFGVIKVNLAVCNLEGLCCIDDSSPYGIAAHELGHHWTFIQGRKTLWSLWPKTERLTEYEPCVEEAIAESFRLFMCNPDALLRLRPERYTFFLSRGLQPIERRGFLQVMEWAQGVKSNGQGSLCS